MSDLLKDPGPHAYWPSTMHMGGCDVCGNLADHPNHVDIIPAVPFQGRLQFLDGSQPAERACRVCDCTETQACMTALGPCSWVEFDLCSGCAGQDDAGKRHLALVAAQASSDATAELVRFAAEGAGLTGLFEVNVVDMLLDAVKLAMEAEGVTGGERATVYAAVSVYLVGEVPA